MRGEHQSRPRSEFAAARDLLVANCRLITPFECLDGGALLVRDGHIAEVGLTGEVAAPAGARLIDAGGAIVAPGFVDLQVNGAGGHDVMAGDADEIRALAAWLSRFGCTSFLPTTVTAAPERLRAALAAIAEARRTPMAGARVLGAHVEGPFISASPVGRGAHDISQIRPFDPAEWAALVALDELAEPLIRVVTIAPEIEANRLGIAIARAAGAAVSIGHTAATYPEAAAGARAGATLVTHAYNAMRGLHHREPGALGAALDLPELACGLIADGYHVHPAAMRTLIRAKGIDRVFAVSDAAWIAGLPPGEYTWAGGPIRFDGLAPRDLDGRLAGSALTMIRAVNSLVALVGLPLADALRLATTNPARAIGLDAEIGSLRVGALADLVLLEPADRRTEDGRLTGGKIEVVKTIVGGEVAYERV